MDTKQAISIIKQACSSVVANLETHQQIQKAIQAVELELENKKGITSE